MNQRIGVYICHCGSNISDVVDVKKVRDSLSNLPELIVVKTLMFACADSSQKEIIEDIHNSRLDAVVVASCSPKLHLHTFRSVVERAGLNYNQYVQVNIREQASWAHGDKPSDATVKSIQLIKAGIARVKLAEPLTPVNIEALDSVLIIGAGVAGLRSAIEMADMGLHVYLIEKNHYVGGLTSGWESVFLTDQAGNEIIENLYKEIKCRNNIQLFTGAEVLKKSGGTGNFEVEIRIKPEYIKEEIGSEELNSLINLCPAVKENPRSFGLSSACAISSGSGLFPDKPFIYREHCIPGCSECMKIFEGIDLNVKPEVITVKCGAILFCTGSEPYQPSNGEFGYLEYENVITLPQFKKLIENQTDNLFYREKAIKNIAYIYCVGSRQIEGVNKYCSRFCCSAAIHTAIIAKYKFQDISNFHFNRGIRTYGKHEILYNQSCSNGDVYLQFNEDNPVTFSKDESGRSVITVKDILTASKELELQADLIVLVTGLVPAENITISDIFKVPSGRDKFYNEVHPKLRPVETVLDGIYIAGCCQGPKTISESVRSALSASSKIYTLLGNKKLSLEPTQARINIDECKWCENCFNACPFDAIEKIQVNNNFVASVKSAVCKGCGMCLPVCNSNAIDLVGFSDAEIESTIDALVS